MAVKAVRLSREDRIILESYKNMVTSLAAYLGEAYEIALHSLEDPEHSVIAIANGFHTGREIGAPITDLAVYWLDKIAAGETEADQYCYFSKNKLGEPLKSSTMAIRGVKGNIIGLLCMNLYLGTPMLHMISDLIPQESASFATEHYVQQQDSIEVEIRNAQDQVTANASIPASQYKKEVIRILNSRHVFEIKNSIERVANALDISVNTVYFHLRNIAREN